LNFHSKIQDMIQVLL